MDVLNQRLRRTASCTTGWRSASPSQHRSSSSSPLCSSSILSQENPTFANSICAHFLHLYKEKELSDVTLCVHDRQFFCHRLILAAHSTYFHAMFCSDFKEKTEFIIPIKSVSPSAMEIILSYMYTGKVEVALPDLGDLFSAANLLQVMFVLEAAENLILQTMNIHNCVEIFRLGRQYHRTNLINFATEFMDRNLTYVTTTEDFVNLPLEDLQFFIVNPHNDKATIYDLCNAMLKWCREDTGSRVPHLFQLLSLFPLHGVTEDELLRLSKDRLISSTPECLQLIRQYQAIDGIVFDCESPDPHDQCGLASMLYQPGIDFDGPTKKVGSTSATMGGIRNPVYGNTGLPSEQFVFMLISERDQNPLLIDPINGHLSTLSCQGRLDQRRIFPDLQRVWSVTKDCLYLLTRSRIYEAHGGSQSEMQNFEAPTPPSSPPTASSTSPVPSPSIFYLWRPVTRFSRAWTEVERVVAVGKYILVVGVFGDHGRFMSIERYSLSDGVWTTVPMPPSQEAASQLCTTYVACSGVFFAISVSKTCAYSPSLNTWRDLEAPLTISCAIPESAAVKGKIYVMDRYFGLGTAREIVCFDPSTKQWSSVFSFQSADIFNGIHLPGFNVEDMTANVFSLWHLFNHNESLWLSFSVKGYDSRNGCLLLARLDMGHPAKDPSTITSVKKLTYTAARPFTTSHHNLRSVLEMAVNTNIPLTSASHSLPSLVVEKVFSNDAFWGPRLRQSVYNCSSVLMDPLALESMRIQT